MPKADQRGSLLNLKTNLPKVAPIQSTEEMEKHILSSKEEPRSPDSAGTDERLRAAGSEPGEEIHVPSNTVPAVQKKREGTVLLNAKIPVSVHTRLKRTAQYNDVSMTDILLRGIEHELKSGRYSQPPSTWGGDESSR